MPRYAMAIDLNYCIGCYTCQVACKDEHVGNEFPPISKSQPTFGQFWMSIEEREMVYSPSHIKVAYIATPCQHCNDPSCMKAAGDRAIYKRSDGIVIIDPEKAKGQKKLLDACPYGNIFWNEEENIPQKGTFCAHLLDDGWDRPRCVQACPVSTIHFGDLDDPESDISRFLSKNQGGEPLYPEKGTKPTVRYVGLPKPHMAGSVIFGDRDECAKAVNVTLTGPEGNRLKTQTDFFGDFAFDGIQKGKYTVQFDAAGYARQTKEVEMTADELYIGEIIMSAKKN